MRTFSGPSKKQYSSLLSKYPHLGLRYLVFSTHRQVCHQLLRLQNIWWTTVIKGCPGKLITCNFIWQSWSNTAIQSQLSSTIIEQSPRRIGIKYSDQSKRDVFPVAPRKLSHQSENWSIIPINTRVLKNASQKLGGFLLWIGLDPL